MVTAGSFRAGGLFIFVKEMINIAIKLATSITYTADGSQTNFSVPFDYLRPSFVHVSVNDAEVSEGFTISNRMVMFDSAPAKDAVVYIYRSTPTTRLVSWADASILKAIDMTIAEVQQLHILEEANDWSKTHSIVFDEERGVWQGRNYRVSSVSDPTEAQDVVTKNYLENTEDSFVQRMNAIKTQTEQFANTAGNSKDSAYKSAQSASVSAASATESAKLAEGYKNIAETAKSDASLYAANAKTSAANATASKEAAQSAATSASNFATDARNSAGEAKTYKDNAKTYRDNAKTYMDNAKNYSENVNVFTPSVSTSGVLSWTNKAGLANPPSVNIKGEKGDQGLQGIQGVKGVKGDTGAKGDRGATGAAATIRIGTVTTGASGSEAVVTNVGTANDAVFNFTLPRGEKGADGGIDIDTALSDTSTNPVQNKVIKSALDECAKQGASNNLISYGNEFNFIPKDGTTNGNTWIVINYRFGDTAVTSDKAIAGYTFGNGTGNSGPNLASIKAKEFIGNATSATKATQDGNGNVISTTYAKLLEANKWSEQQYFKVVKLVYEKYISSNISGTVHVPSASVIHYVATGAFTLNLSNIVSNLKARESTVFTAYIESSADYSLTITNAGTIKYIGSASDVALTKAGLLLNILIMKDAEDNMTSIVQASKLEGGA